MKRHKTVTQFLEAHGEYKAELLLLRNLCLANEDLKETVKWGAPTYMDANGKNVVSLGAFKSYVGLWFFQGSFLKDSKKKLMNAQEGTTRGMRQWRFENAAEIEKDTATIKAYLKEAVANSLEGKEIKPDRTKAKQLVMPDELTAALKANQTAKVKFDALSPYKQREYADYISGAKREATRLSRLEKILPMIEAGKGLNDKYR